MVLPKKLLPPRPEDGEMGVEASPGARGRSEYKEEGELRGCLKRPEGLMGLGAPPP